MQSENRNQTENWEVEKYLICVSHCSSPVLLYSGGMPRASYGDRHCLTIQQDKDHVTLDFTSRVIDFFTVHSVEQERGQNLTCVKDGVCNITFS